MAKSSETKTKILHAALDLFSEYGASATTTRMIANQAGVNEVTLFRHFNSKEALFNEVFAEVERISLCSDKVIREDLPARAAIEFFIRELSDILVSNPKIVRMILFGHLDHVSQFEKAFLDEYRLKMESFLDKKLKTYLKDRPNRKLDKINNLTMAIMSQLLGLAVGHTLFKERFDADEFDVFIEELIRIYLD